MKMARQIVNLILAILVSALSGISPAGASTATNQATRDLTLAGDALTASGLVTVNSSNLQLVKQVYTVGGTCLASIPADTTCNSSAISTTVPAGTTLKFLIFVRNTTSIALTDIRIEDLLDDTASGFTYIAGSIKRTPMDTTAPLDTALLTGGGGIFPAADSGVDAIAAGQASINTAVSPDRITVGAVVGQANGATSIAANRTFAVLFQASKN